MENFKNYIHTEQDCITGLQTELDELLLQEQSRKDDIENAIAELTVQRDKLQSQIDYLISQKAEPTETNNSRCYYEGMIKGCRNRIDSMVEKIDSSFGGYRVSDLGPVLAKLASELLGQRYSFLIEQSDHIRSSRVGNEAYYIRDEAKIINAETGTELCTFAVGEEPDEKDYWSQGYFKSGIYPKEESVYSRFYFLIDTPLASFSAETGSFACEIPEKSATVPCNFIEDFICYISDVRLERACDEKNCGIEDVMEGKIRAKELQQYADRFLLEHRDDYSSVAPQSAHKKFGFLPKIDIAKRNNK